MKPDLQLFKAVLYSVLVFFVWLPTPSAAQSAAEEPLFKSEAPTVETGTVGSLLQVIFSLILVLVLIVFLLRFLSKRSKMFHSSNGLTRLAGIQLGQNKSLQVIECGDHLYVIGVGEDVQLIDKISSPEEIERWKAAMESEQHASYPFSFQSIRQRIHRLRNRTSLEQEHHDFYSNASFQEVFVNKMKQVNEDKRRRLQDLLQEEQSEDRPHKP